MHRISSNLRSPTKRAHRQLAASLFPSVGRTLKVKLNRGGSIKGTFKSTSADSLVLEQKAKQVQLSRDEIVSVAVVTKKSAATATWIGVAVGGGTGAVLGGAAEASCGGFCGGNAPARGAGVIGAIGAAGGGLVGYFIRRRSHKETLIYHAVPTK